MPDYSKGKIYAIYSPSLNITYIGSTTKTLKERLYGHLKGNTTGSKQVLKCNDYKITLLENFPCANRYELEMRETEYIKNNECVNIALPPCCLVPPKNTYKEHEDKMKPYMKTWKISISKI